MQTFIVCPASSTFSMLAFEYTTRVVMLGKKSGSIDIGDLPILQAGVRSMTLYARMRAAMRWRLHRARPGSGLELVYRLTRTNGAPLALVVVLSVTAAVVWYIPAYFLRELVRYLEVDPARKFREWGVLFVVGTFASNIGVGLRKSFICAACRKLAYADTYTFFDTVAGHLFSLCSTELEVRVKTQLNSALFLKTLLRKDVASTTASEAAPDGATNTAKDGAKEVEAKDQFSSKAQVMTLMTTDADRVSSLSRDLFFAVDAPIEVIVGAYFLYSMLGVSSFVGLAVIVVFMPINHYASKLMVTVQEDLMKARDERVSLMNEVCAHAPCHLLP